MIYKDKVAVISGANGFIGTHLAQTLLRKGCKVASIPRELLEEPVSLGNFLKEANPNYIFHLAAYGNHFDQKDIDHTIYANVIKTYTLLRASLDIPYEAFINVSSSSVYGRKDYTMREKDSLEPSSMYGATKAAGEYLARGFAVECDKPIASVRPFSVYGPGEAEHRLIPTIVRSIVRGEKLELYTDPVHDWIYVTDFIEGMLNVTENIEHFKGESLNIGTGRQTSNEFIFNMLKGLTKDVVSVEMLEGGRPNDLKNWKADTARIRTYGWEPKVSLDNGLITTYAYYKDIYMPKEPSIKDAMERSLSDMGFAGFSDSKEIVTSL